MIFTGAFLARSCIAAGASAKPMSVWPVATSCAVVPEPRPSSMVRSMPAFSYRPSAFAYMNPACGPPARKLSVSFIGLRRLRLNRDRRAPQ